MIIRNEEQKKFYELEKEQRRFIADCFVNEEMGRLEFRVLGFSHDDDESCGKWIPLGSRSKTLNRNGIYRTASYGPIKVKWDRIDKKWGYVAIEECGSICLMRQTGDDHPIVAKVMRSDKKRWYADGDSIDVTHVLAADTFEIPSGLKWEESLTMRPRDA